MKVFLVTCLILTFLGVFAFVYTVAKYFFPEEESDNLISVQLPVGEKFSDNTQATSPPEELAKGGTSKVLDEAEDDWKQSLLLDLDKLKSMH